MKTACLLALILNTFLGLSQIQVGGEQPKEKGEKKKEKEQVQQPVVEPVDTTKKVVGTTAVFVSTTWNNTYRVLNRNESIFGDSIGIRADETALNTWSFSLGFRSKINSYLFWEGGISYITNGEQYTGTLGDSTLSYSNKYQYIGMPLKVYFTYGNKLQVHAGIGVVPQMAMKLIRNETVVDAVGNETSTETKTKINQNSFVFSMIANLGVHWQASERIGLFVYPEFRRQLSSSYLRTNAYKHYATAMGVQFGLTIHF